MNILKEAKSVRAVIELYIEGTKTGDIKKLEQVFHPEAIMSGNLMEKSMVCGTTEPFYRDVEGKTAPPEYDAQIINIDIIGGVASATLIETGLMGIDFVNYFHLKKVDGKWRILSKLFTSVDND